MSVPILMTGGHKSSAISGCDCSARWPMQVVSDNMFSRISLPPQDVFGPTLVW